MERPDLASAVVGPALRHLPCDLGAPLAAGVPSDIAVGQSEITVDINDSYDRAQSGGRLGYQQAPSATYNVPTASRGRRSAT